MSIKRPLTLILSLIFLISATEMHELVRLPLLVKHFKHHRSQDPSMTFAGFLALHYTADHPNDQDEDDDDDLPFKEMQASHIDIIDLQLASEPVDHSIISSVTIPPSIGSPLQQSVAIFHPPRFV